MERVRFPFSRAQSATGARDAREKAAKSRNRQAACRGVRIRGADAGDPSFAILLIWQRGLCLPPAVVPAGSCSMAHGRSRVEQQQRLVLQVEAARVERKGIRRLARPAEPPQLRNRIRIGVEQGDAEPLLEIRQ